MMKRRMILFIVAMVITNSLCAQRGASLKRVASDLIQRLRSIQSARRKAMTDLRVRPFSVQHQRRHFNMPLADSIIDDAYRTYAQGLTAAKPLPPEAFQKLYNFYVVDRPDVEITLGGVVGMTRNIEGVRGSRPGTFERGLVLREILQQARLARQRMPYAQERGPLGEARVPDMLTVPFAREASSGIERRFAENLERAGQFFDAPPKQVRFGDTYIREIYPEERVQFGDIRIRGVEPEKRVRFGDIRIREIEPRLYRGGPR